MCASVLTELRQVTHLSDLLRKVRSIRFGYSGFQHLLATSLLFTQIAGEIPSAADPTSLLASRYSAKLCHCVSLLTQARHSHDQLSIVSLYRTSLCRYVSP